MTYTVINSTKEFARDNFFTFLGSLTSIIQDLKSCAEKIAVIDDAVNGQSEPANQQYLWKFGKYLS